MSNALKRRSKQKKKMKQFIEDGTKNGEYGRAISNVFEALHWITLLSLRDNGFGNIRLTRYNQRIDSMLIDIASGRSTQSENIIKSLNKGVPIAEYVSKIPFRAKIKLCNAKGIKRDDVLDLKTWVDGAIIGYTSMSSLALFEEKFSVNKVKQMVQDNLFKLECYGEDFFEIEEIPKQLYEEVKFRARR